MRTAAIAPYAPVLIKLLQGIVYYDDETTWNMLLQHQSPVVEHFERMGLALYLDEAEGYAYLYQPEPNEDDPDARPLPRLTRRDHLSYPVTLLLVLLREALQQFDNSEPQSDRLVLSIEELRDLQRPFYRDQNDQIKLVRLLDGYVSRVAELGFLRRLSSGAERYEVKRILTAKISADMLGEIKEKLQRHVEHAD